MIKCIDVSELKVGMYIHDLNCDWMSHPFLINRFKVKDDSEIQKIADAGIHEVYIDTRKGLDLPSARSEGEVRKQLESELREIASRESTVVRRVEAAEEFGRARSIHDEANQIVRDILQDVRLGKQVELEQVEPQVEKLTESILRNGGALLSLCRIKDKDNYTFQHSVSVGALMVSFCNGLGMSKEVIHHAGIGGMLHDIGKMRVPNEILNKPGKLTEQEFQVMKCHVVESQKILHATRGISETAVLVAGQHHERHDGSGYPAGLKGEQISQLGQMAAIVDVYDALTSERCYHQGMSPTDALRKIYEWSKFHFNPELVQAFMRVIGIYPIGTLVRLESGRLGVVIEQNDNNLVSPKVKVFFSTKSNTHIAPEIVDLSRKMGFGGGDRIVKHESPEKWHIDPLRFL
ncbi:HD-GYP domain-containing protein [Chromobacterium vaccinii]|uniref:HD-GYP domain-containing protein n=2 Tax=Chromobacteriaceae TaxID=1499392 RepID=A0ABV0FB89_9NEIS|nr:MULTISPECIES: HD-GYP domain-containing protein [Chromobacteriaceae]ERE05834.1 phosphohydrolase [Pseudogulbenkiania ferrooxidans EGD-HP2]MCD4483090.1 HD-GYP domain-containing protein [Chromobacterium vaccinii]